MSTVGLTKAQREWIETLRARAIERGWVAVDPNDKGRRFITPRGHAALAAPRMTQAEYDAMRGIEERHKCSSYRYKHQISSVVFNRMERAGWITKEPNIDGWVELTPAGRTALNNVRAAMPGEWRQVGSPDWKEGL